MEKINRKAQVFAKSGLDFFRALKTNSFALKIAKLRACTAENTGILVFCHDNSVVFNENLNGRRFADSHFLAHFLGDNKSAELVNISDNSG